MKSCCSVSSLSLLAGRLHLPGQQFQLGAEMIGDDAGFAARGRFGSAARAGVAPLEQVGEEHVGLVAAAVDLLLLLASGRGAPSRPLLRAVVVELVEHVLDSGRW